MSLNLRTAQLDPACNFFVLLSAQDEKFDRAEELTEEAKRAVRVAHAEAQEAERKRQEAGDTEKAAQDAREHARADAEKLSQLRAQVWQHGHTPLLGTCCLSSVEGARVCWYLHKAMQSPRLWCVKIHCTACRSPCSAKSGCRLTLMLRSSPVLMPGARKVSTLSCSGQEEAAKLKRQDFEEARKKAHQKAREYEGARAQAAAAEEAVHDRARALEAQIKEVEEKKVPPSGLCLTMGSRCSLLEWHKQLHY